jgi:hypothetical protein
MISVQCFSAFVSLPWLAVSLGPSSNTNLSIISLYELPSSTFSTHWLVHWTVTHSHSVFKHCPGLRTYTIGYPHHLHILTNHNFLSGWNSPPSQHLDPPIGAPHCHLFDHNNSGTCSSISEDVTLSHTSWWTPSGVSLESIWTFLKVAATLTY